jgi:hypothetical protein
MGLSIDDRLSFGKVDAGHETSPGMKIKLPAKIIMQVSPCLLVPLFALGCNSDLRTGWSGKGDGGGADRIDTSSAAGSTGGAGAGGTADSGVVFDPGNLSAEGIESFCTGFYTYYTKALTTCLTGSSLAYATMAPGVPEAICVRIVRSVHAGLSRYDKQRGTACLAALASSGPFPLSACADLNTTAFNSLDCRSSITPAVSAGGPASPFWSQEPPAPGMARNADPAPRATCPSRRPSPRPGSAWPTCPQAATARDQAGLAASRV